MTMPIPLPDPENIDICDGRVFDGGVRLVEAPTGAVLGYEAVHNFDERHTLHLGIRDTPEEAARLMGQVEKLLAGAWLDCK